MKGKKILAGAVFVLVFIAGLIYGTARQDFDAKGYVRAVLDANLKGEVTQAAQMIGAQDETELRTHYHEGIENFLQNNILGESEADTETYDQYYNLCREIFQNMEYEVTDAEKISSKEFRVTVTYQTTDLFPLFAENVEKESKEFFSDVGKKKYKGTEEKILSQMQQEFLTRSYDCLLQAFKEAKDQGEGRMIFTVKGDASNVFYMDEDQISEMIAKILQIGEKQD